LVGFHIKLLIDLAIVIYFILFDLFVVAVFIIIINTFLVFIWCFGRFSGRSIIIVLWWLLDLMNCEIIIFNSFLILLSIKIWIELRIIFVFIIRLLIIVDGFDTLYNFTFSHEFIVLFKIWTRWVEWIN